MLDLIAPRLWDRREAAEVVDFGERRLRERRIGLRWRGNIKIGTINDTVMVDKILAGNADPAIIPWFYGMLNTIVYHNYGRLW